MDNLSFYLRLMQSIRTAIKQKDLKAFVEKCLDTWDNF